MSTGAYDRMQLWANSNTWIPYVDFNLSNVAILFDFMASETTLQYHDILKAWFVVIVNSFVYGSSIIIRVAASPYGPWSQPIPVFTIPSQFLQQGDFCYAGKVGILSLNCQIFLNLPPRPPDPRVVVCRSMNFSGHHVTLLQAHPGDVIDHLLRYLAAAFALMPLNRRVTNF
jgi:hypothetical protein